MHTHDPNDADLIATMVSKATTPAQVAEILETLAAMHQAGDFPYDNYDMPSFLRGLSAAVQVFEREPEGEFAEVAKQGQWRVLSEIILLGLGLS